MPPTQFDSYIFDLDGTIYLGDALLPGAADVIAQLRARGNQVVFCSNNPTRPPEAYAAKLTRLGIPTQPSDVVTSLIATVEWISATMPHAAVFPIGELPLTRALVQAGIEVSDDPTRIDLVVASYDRTLTYRKLQIAFDALWYHRRARLVSTNPDAFCPFPEGRGEPDAAAVVAALSASTGVECEAAFGKPDPALFGIIAARTGMLPQSTLMVGDRLATDIGLAHNAGLTGALVLTGDSTVDDAWALPDARRPHLVARTLSDILDPAACARWQESGPAAHAAPGGRTAPGATSPVRTPQEVA